MGHEVRTMILRVRCRDHPDVLPSVKEEKDPVRAAFWNVVIFCPSCDVVLRTIDVWHGWQKTLPEAETSQVETSQAEDWK